MWRCGGQPIFVVQGDDLSLAPLVVDEHSVFLKTIIPSRAEVGND